MQQGWCSYKKRDQSSHPHAEDGPCEDTVIRQLSAKEKALPRPWPSWHLALALSTPQKCEKIHFDCSSHPVCGALLWQPGRLTWSSEESVSCSVMSSSLQPHGLYPTRLLYLWNSPGQNTGVSSHSFLQGIFLTQGLNPGIEPRFPALQADSLLSHILNLFLDCWNAWFNAHFISLSLFKRKWWSFSFWITPYSQN